MKRLFLSILVLLLAGCVTQVPVSENFPDVPLDLLVACPDLKEVQPGTTKLSEVLPTIVDNYTQYQECRLKVDTWIEWYKHQKDIFDIIK